MGAFVVIRDRGDGLVPSPPPRVDARKSHAPREGETGAHVAQCSRGAREPLDPRHEFRQDLLVEPILVARRCLHGGRLLTTEHGKTQAIVGQSAEDDRLRQPDPGLELRYLLGPSGNDLVGLLDEALELIGVGTELNVLALLLELFPRLAVLQVQPRADDEPDQ